MYKTKQAALDALNQQPFTLQCRARHIIVPCFSRNLLGEVQDPRPVGYAYRLRSANE